MEVGLLPPLHPRQRQTGRKAGTQSQGPADSAAGSLAAERMMGSRFGKHEGEAFY